MKKYCIATIIICLLYSCANHSEQASTTAVQPPAENPLVDSFFPVTSFIRGQIMVLDSLPITPLKITTEQQKSDSTWLAKKDVQPLLQPFISPVIDETNLTRYFKETKFNDQTLNAITFTYDPLGNIPDSIQVRHWDVYVDPEKGVVTKVYIVKNIRENNQSYTQQLTWQTGKMAKISTILNKPGGEMQLVKEMVLQWKF